MISSMCMCVLELTSNMLIISDLSGKRGKRIFVGSTILLLLEVALLYIVNRFALWNIGNLFPHVVMIIGLYFIYKERLTNCVLYCIIAFALCSGMEIILYLPFLGPVGKWAGDLMAGFTGTIGVLAVTYLCYKYKWVHWEILRKYIQLKRRLLCYICVIIGIIFLTAKYQFGFARSMPAYAFVFLIFLVALFFPLASMYVRNETELRVRSKYEQPILDILTRIRQQQHQYDHQLNAIYGMIHHYKTYDELAAHLQEYMETIEGADPCYSLFTELEDPLLAGFLGVKFSRAASMGIEVEHEIVVKTIHSNISLPELVGILGNVFDNAMEEVADHSLLRKIRIRIWEESGWYRIRLGNPCREAVTGSLSRLFEKGFSTKDGDGQRGLGLCSVADTVNKYKGQVSVATKVEEEINWFYIDLMIKKTDEEKTS